MCIDYLKNPSGAIEEIKEKEMHEGSVGIMALAAILFAINSAIALNLLNMMPVSVTGPSFVVKILNMGMVNLGVLVFFTVFLGGLFFGWVTKTIMNLLGGEGGYFEGLTTIAYPVLAATVGILVAMVLSYIPVVGTLLAFITIAVSFSVAYASMYRFAKELFDTDMITAFVGISVLFAIVIVSIYGSLATTSAGLKAIAPAA